jgi:hypothetical protein
MFILYFTGMINLTRFINIYEHDTSTINFYNLNDLFRVQAIKVMQVKFKQLKKGSSWEIRNQIKMPPIAHQILL